MGLKEVLVFTSKFYASIMIFTIHWGGGDSSLTHAKNSIYLDQ